MRRRAILTLAGGAVVAWPRVATAQAGRLRKVGFLGANTPAAAGHLATAFAARLKQLGWVEGRDLAIEYRWAAGQIERYREIAFEFVATGVDVIVTSGNAPGIAAARATTTIPIVLASSADIVGAGLVKSLSRPGGNVTGLTFAPEDTVGKRLELLKEAVPGLVRVGVLFNPSANPEELAAIRAAAPSLALALAEFEFRGVPDLDRIAASPDRASVQALLVMSDPLVFVNRIAINDFALRERLPTMHRLEEYAIDGGLISYGPSFPDFFRRAAELVDKILKGARPEDLPVERPTVFRLVINLKTANALGLALPGTLLARADEVIE